MPTNKFLALCNFRTLFMEPKPLPPTFFCTECDAWMVGKKEDFQHCYTCDMCLPPHHKVYKCIQNRQTGDCAVCLERLREPEGEEVSLLRCGHDLHSICLTKLVENDHYRCCTCQVTFLHPNDAKLLWDEVRSRIAARPQTTQKIEIYCNDCRKASIANFHDLANECLECHSFNTRQV